MGNKNSKKLIKLDCGRYTMEDFQHMMDNGNILTEEKFNELVDLWADVDRSDWCREQIFHAVCKWINLNI